MTLFKIHNTHTNVWKNSLLVQAGNGLQVVAKTTSCFTWCNRIVRWFVHFFNLSSSFDKVRRVFISQRDSLMQRCKEDWAQWANPTSRRSILKRIYQCNKNIHQFNMKILKHNAKVWFAFQKYAVIEMAPLPYLQPRNYDNTYCASLKGRLDGIPLPDNNAPDLVKLHQWVMAQNAHLQPFAYALAQKVVDSYVSFDEFLANLDKNGAEIKKICADRPFGLVTSSESSKSGNWVRRLSTLSQLAAIRLTPLSIEDDKLKQEQRQIHDWVVIDDASYSAQQVREEIVTGLIRGLVNQVAGEIRIYIAIPFMTRFARKHITEKMLGDICESRPKLQEHISRIKIMAMPTAIMESVQDVIDNLENPEDKGFAERSYQSILGHPERLSTTYFAHKIGDRLSFPQHVKDGGIYPHVNLDGSSDPYYQQECVVRPLSDFTPPYKRARIRQSKTS